MRTSSSWVNYFLWKCERHIPTSKVYPELIAKCPACGFARPDAAYRPPMFPEEEKPVVRVVPPPPPPSPVSTEPAKTFAEDMSLGQAQRDLDATVMADLVAAAEKLKKSRVKAPPPPKVEPPKVEPPPPPRITWVDDPEPEIDEEPGPVVPEATPSPVTNHTEKRPKDIPNAQKSKAHLCPGPKCRKVSRRNSPYCSKICSDRCLRLRKKATEKVLTAQEIKWLNRILDVLEAWGSDTI